MDKRKPQKFPPFVKMSGRVLRHLGQGCYYREAGYWSVMGRRREGALRAFSTFSRLDHVNGLPLIACTEEEWREDNAGYV